MRRDRPDCCYWKRPDWRYWKQAAAVAVPLTAGLLLRVVWSLRATLDDDEAFSWNLAQFGPLDVVRLTALDTHPPAYYLALQAWQGVAGATILSSRLFSAVCGCVSALFLYRCCLQTATATTSESCGARRFGAFVAACIVAVHPLQVQYGGNIRMYAFGAMLMALSMWLLLRCLGDPAARLRNWAAYGLAAAALCYTHFFGILAVVAQLIAAAAYCRAARIDPATGTFAWRRLQGLAAATAVIGLAFAAWIPALVDQITRVRQDFWIPALTPFGVSQIVTTVFSGAPLSEPAECCGCLALMLGVVALQCYWRDRIGLFFLNQIAVTLVLALTLSLASERPILIERCLIFVQIAWAGLLGVTIGRISKAPEKALVAAAVVLPPLWGLAALSQSANCEPSAARQFASAFVEESQPGEIVLTFRNEDALRLRCYLADRGAPTTAVCKLSERIPLGGSEEWMGLALPNAIKIALAEELPEHGKRLWTATARPSEDWIAVAWELVSDRTYQGADGSRLFVSLYSWRSPDDR